MIDKEVLQIVEGLSRLDPISTYPERAARLVARLADAVAYRVEFDNGETQRWIDSTPPPILKHKSVSIPLRYGRREVGSMRLFLQNGNDTLDETAMRLTQWGARGLARGMSYISRMIQQRHSSVPMESGMVGRIPDGPGNISLTPREKQVITLLLAGSSTRGIAGQTGLTVNTVQTYLKRVFIKFGVHSRVELIARIRGSEAKIPTLPPLPQIDMSPKYGIDSDLPNQKLN